jgi:hypothetical protein
MSEILPRPLIERVSVPEGASGAWRVERFEVPERSIQSLRLGWRAPTPGIYTRLMRGRQLVMSDTPAEMSDHFEPVRRATGHCLVNGLGLGMVACAMARRAEQVTVIEVSEDVIALVASTLPANVKVIQSCAYAYQPMKGKRYAVVWHDIWDDLCTDNLPEMAKLHRKYGRWADWQGSWGRELLEAERRRNRRGYGS